MSDEQRLDTSMIEKIREYLERYPPPSFCGVPLSEILLVLIPGKYADDDTIIPASAEQELLNIELRRTGVNTKLYVFDDNLYGFIIKKPKESTIFDGMKMHYRK